MWTGLDSLISLRTAASVVDLPEPVAPVTSTRPVFSLGISLKISGNFNFSSVGMIGVQLAADDGIIAALRENIDAETGLVRKRIGGVAGAVAQQILDVPEVVADDVERDGLGLERRELVNRRVEHDRLEFAVGFHLRRAVHGEQQVGNLRLRGQHRGQNLIQFGSAHNDQSVSSSSGGWASKRRNFFLSSALS